MTGLQPDLHPDSNPDFLDTNSDTNSDSDSNSNDSHSDPDPDIGLLEFPMDSPMSHAILEPGEADDLSGNNPDHGLDVHMDLPGAVADLQEKLLNGYQCPPHPTGDISKPKVLSTSQSLSLKHYIAWRKSNGTVLAYKLHAHVLQDACNDTTILSLHAVHRLASHLTGLEPVQVDICPGSCIAYTGSFEELDSCPFVWSGSRSPCGLPCYKQKQSPNAQATPHAQMLYIPIIPVIRAMFTNEETSRLLCYRDHCLQQALHLVATAPRAHAYSDFANAYVHLQQYENGLFQDSRDIAFALSTDGAQLTMKKQSDTWILILIILNLPPEICYKSSNTIVAFATPGPRGPGDIESFLYPLFKEMAMASAGIWVWDAVDSSYFTNRSCICMALGDMLGSAKLSGMAGHSAVFGDHFSMVRGAHASLKPGAKSQYYPISPPQSQTYNPECPVAYDLDNLPMRNSQAYWETIRMLQDARSKAQAQAITHRTGISCMSLCAASPAYDHPTFFPLDPFHLFYENCMAFLWDLWVTMSSPSEIIHLSVEKACTFGNIISDAMSTLPPSFCGTIWDPYLKWQSQYKVFEWMALLHWYIIPIGIELEFNPTVLENFSFFAEAVEIAMTIQPMGEKDLLELMGLIKAFLTGFEQLYVGDDPEKVSHC